MRNLTSLKVRTLRSLKVRNLRCLKVRTLKSLKVAQSSFLIFFNTNSLRYECYHTVSFVSMKIISNKCPFIVQQVLIIFIPQKVTIATL